MKRLGSTVRPLVCVALLCAGCTSASDEASPPLGSEPAAPAVDDSTPADTEPPDTTAPATTWEPPAVDESPQAEESSGGLEQAPAAESPVLDAPEAESPVLDAPAAAQDETQSATSVFPPVGVGTDVARWTVEIIESFPHDPEAFTQGLEIAGGTMYESTGLRGRSSLRTVDALTGEVTARVDLAEDLFGEGLTIVGDTLVQLTWTSGTALVYDRETLEELGAHAYEGEGWGLCLSGNVLIMSDGSDRLARRDPETFTLLGTVTVTASGYDGRLDYLNELECVEDLVVANVWQTDRLLVIDPATGRAVASIDAQPLVDDVSLSASSDMDVLNGVALDSDSATLWMTGKLWPRLYKVRIVEVPQWD